MPRTSQEALFPAPNEEPQTLNALIQSARIAARTQSEGGAVGAVVARLAADGGSAAIDVLRAEGFADDVLAAAVTTSTADKRVKPRAKLGIVAGCGFLWLTTTGWQAAGQPSRRERPPTAESAAHAEAPAQLAAWLRTRLEPWPAVRVDVATGDPCRDFSDRVKALAWARIQGAGDTSGGAGSLTGGLVPDALLVERFADKETYARAWGHEPIEPGDLAEQVLALEVEDTRKSDGPLRWKVDKWRTAIELGAVYGVVWVVRRRTVAQRLTDLGVGQATSKQVLVSAGAVGLAGEEMSDGATQWWPLRVASNVPSGQGR